MKIRTRCLTGSITLFIFLPLLCFSMEGLSWSAEIGIGQKAPHFRLPSTLDKLIDYYQDYYGKYHLIITFFPAAFTPV